MNETFLQENQYISQVLLQAEYGKWNRGDKILISGSPNTGKSHFAIEYATYAYKSLGFNTKFIFNRGIIKRQIKHKCNASMHGKIDFIAYQDILKNDIQANLSDLEKCEVIIVDECNCFFDDALFDGIGENTDRLLNYLLNECNNSIVILMTSQDYLIKSYIREYFQSPASYSPLKYKSYSFVKDIKFASCYYWTKDDQIDFLLDNLPPTEKAIYFCTDSDSSDIYKKYNEHYEDKYSGQHKGNLFLMPSLMNRNEYQNYSQTVKSVALHDKYVGTKHENEYKIKKSGKHHMAIDNLIKNARVDAQLLIATSVISTGVNIIDDAVKHIIIDVHDFSTIYQMMARVRAKANNLPNLYIRRRIESQKHYDKLQEQKAIFEYLSSSNLNSMEMFCAEYKIEDLKGLVHIKSGINIGTHPEIGEPVDMPHSKIIALKPNCVVEHKVNHDYNIANILNTYTYGFIHFFRQYAGITQEFSAYETVAEMNARKQIYDSFNAVKGQWINNNQPASNAIKEGLAILTGKKRKSRHYMNEDFKTHGFPIFIEKEREKGKRNGDYLWRYIDKPIEESPVKEDATERDDTEDLLDLDDAIDVTDSLE